MKKSELAETSTAVYQRATASEWAGFGAIAAATARELGLEHEVTASLEELKVIVGRDGKAYTQRILGKHPLGAINIAA